MDESGLEEAHIKNAFEFKKLSEKINLGDLSTDTLDNFLNMALKFFKDDLSQKSQMYDQDDEAYQQSRYWLLQTEVALTKKTPETKSKFCHLWAKKLEDEAEELAKMRIDSNQSKIRALQNASSNWEKLSESLKEAPQPV